LLAFAISPAFATQNNQDEDTPKARTRYDIKGGEVFDKKSNLTWQRCSVGQTWKAVSTDWVAQGIVVQISLPCFL
jgi:hypothetical protein